MPTAYSAPMYASIAQFQDWADQNDVDAGTGEIAGTGGWFEFLLKAASLKFDEMTGRWWDKRDYVTITTHGKDGSSILWLPASIVTLTHVKEGMNGGSSATLVENTDFYRFDSWLEKCSLHAWAVDQGRSGIVQWSTLPFDVEVKGSFGMAATPNDVVALVCAMAAAIGEYRKRTFVNDDGSIAEVPTSAFPKWLQEGIALKARKKIGFPAGYRIAYGTS